VLDFTQLEPFRDLAFIEKITSFFVSRTSPSAKWLIQLTGGEPLIAPNLDRLLLPLIEAGNRIAFYTALLVGENHPGFRFLKAHSHPQVDYIMASFHPEAEMDEPRYFDKIQMLRDAGHKVFLRFVGHPKRLHRLQQLSDRCRELDICFFPTTLMSNNYPRAYTVEQKSLLQAHFSSLTQYIQLGGGLDTTNLKCYGGSRVILINLQTGNITPCATVRGPSLGNVFENRLKLHSAPIRCPEPGIACICDVHFQQDIVLSAEDRLHFDRQLNGFVAPVNFQEQLTALWQETGSFVAPNPRMGAVTDDSRLFYSIDEIKDNYRKARGLPRTGVKRKDLRELVGAVHEIRAASAQTEIHPGTPTRIRTPAAQWSYAAAFPLAIPAEQAGEVWVRIRATVLQGECGLGLLDRTNTTFQDRSFLAVGSEPTTVFLQVTNAAGAESLIIQNGAPNDRPSEIMLEEVTVLAEPAT